MKLSEIKGLSKTEIDNLQKNWIISVEELYSIISNKSLVQNFKQLLNVDDKRLNEIINIINENLSDCKKKEISNFKNNQFKTGAKKPKL